MRVRRGRLEDTASAAATGKRAKPEEALACSGIGYTPPATPKKPIVDDPLTWEGCTYRVCVQGVPRS
jgi:hypothetical protein